MPIETSNHAPPFVTLPDGFAEKALKLLSKDRSLFHVEVTRMLDAYLERIGPKLREPWGSSAARTALDVTKARFRRRDDACDVDSLAGIACKVILHAHVIMSGHDACVPSHERLAVLESFDVRPFRLAPERSPVPDVDLIEFAYTFWHRRPRSRVSVDMHVATSMVRLPSVDASDAPVVARLTSFDGGVVDLRLTSDGRFLRPVFAPGSWSTLDVRALAAACVSGHPWADDPFQQPITCADVIIGWANVAVSPLATPPTLDAAKEAALAAALARAGALTVIDGVVHRDTGPPEAYVRHVSQLNERMGAVLMTRMSWALPCGLDAASSMATFERPHRPRRIGQDTNVEMLRSGLGDVPSLTRIIEDWHRKLERRGDVLLMWDDAPMVEVLNPGALPPDPVFVMRLIESLRVIHDEEPEKSPFREAIDAMAGREHTGPLERRFVRLYAPDNSLLRSDPLLDVLVGMANESIGTDDDVLGFEA